MSRESLRGIFPKDQDQVREEDRDDGEDVMIKCHSSTHKMANNRPVFVRLVLISS